MVIHIITACHNRIKTTSAFIDCLDEQSYENTHLILVDDGCTDGTAQMVREKMPDATIISGDGNLYWGGALHEAYKWILEQQLPDDDVVFFSNDDNIFEKTYLEDSLEHLKGNPGCLIAGNAFSIQTGKHEDGVSDYNFKNGDIELLGTESEGNLTDTRALMMWVKDLKKIGGFHPILLPHYLSDYEFVLRAYKKGYKMRTFDNLRYGYDTKLTGIKNLKKMTLKQLFSKRCPYNPIYKFNFLFMVTPLKWLPGRIAWQFKNYVDIATKKKTIEW